MSDALIGQIISGVVTLLVALLGYMKLKAGQKTVEGKVDSYKVQVDGMKTELIEATKGKYQGEGELKGRADQKAEAKVEAESKPAEVVDVKIVDQDKVIKVGIEKPK